MQKWMSIVFLAGGVLLMIGGMKETQSFGAEIAQLLDGAPSGRAVWMLLAGLILFAVGLLDILKRIRRGRWDHLFSPLSFLSLSVIAGLQGFSADTAMTASIAGVFFVITLVLFLASLLQANRG